MSLFAIFFAVFGAYFAVSEAQLRCPPNDDFGTKGSLIQTITETTNDAPTTSRDTR